MTSKTRAKGYRMEKALEKAHNDEGVPCERVPMSGSMGGKYSGDLCIPNIHESLFRAECKARKDGAGFTLIKRWLEGNDILFTKLDRDQVIVTMPWNIYIRLMKAYYGNTSVS